jgi:hypothetical protein
MSAAAAVGVQQLLGTRYLEVLIYQTAACYSTCAGRAQCSQLLLLMLLLLSGMLCVTSEAINTGPLEATIHNLGKDIEAKGREGQELQRRWINRQTELVALQVGCSL